MDLNDENVLLRMTVLRSNSFLRAGSSRLPSLCCIVTEHRESCGVRATSGSIHIDTRIVPNTPWLSIDSEVGQQATASQVIIPRVQDVIGRCGCIKDFHGQYHSEKTSDSTHIICTSITILSSLDTRRSIDLTL